MSELRQSELYARLPENAVRILSLDQMPDEASRSFWRAPKLCCRLEIAVLEFPLIPDYDALSYVWGDATEQIPILCNGKFLLSLTLQDALGVYITIGQSLYSALSQIWELEPEQRIWADALCINQADLSEKSEQVAMMARIYASALQVRVWLGPEGRLTRLLMERIQSCRTAEGLKEEVNQDIALQMAFYHLGSRSWFYRMWTYQEIVLAPKAIVQCGLLRLDWPTFKEVSKRLQFAHNAVQTHVISPVGQSRQTEKPGFAAVFNLQRELQETYDRGATDLRDKIYALLGLPSLKLFRQIRPDYTLSLVDAYTQVAREFIATAQNLSILLMAGIANRKAALREAVSDPGRSFGNLREHPVWRTPSSGLGNRLITPATTDTDKRWLLAWESIAANLPSWVPNWNVLLDTSGMTETWRRSLEGPARPIPYSGILLGPGSRNGKIELRGRALGVFRAEKSARSLIAGVDRIEAFPDCARDGIAVQSPADVVDMSSLFQLLREHDERRCECAKFEPKFLDLTLSSEFYVQMKIAAESGDWICSFDGFSELCLLRQASQMSLTRTGVEYARVPEFEFVSPFILQTLDSIKELPRNVPGFELSFLIR